MKKLIIAIIGLFVLGGSIFTFCSCNDSVDITGTYILDEKNSDSGEYLKSIADKSPGMALVLLDSTHSKENIKKIMPSKLIVDNGTICFVSTDNQSEKAAYRTIESKQDKGVVLLITEEKDSNPDTIFYHKREQTIDFHGLKYHK